MRQVAAAALGLLLIPAPGLGGENIIRAGAGFSGLLGNRCYERCADAQLSAGYGRPLAGPLEVDVGAEVILRPFGFVPAKISVNVEDTLVLVPLGLRVVSPALGRRWSVAAGGGGTIFLYQAANFFPGTGSSSSFQKLGWHALGSASFALTADGRLRLAATPRFAAYNGRGLLNRVFSFTGGIEWRF